MSEATISEEQVLHNELSFEINQELIHLMKRIIEIQRANQQLKEVIEEVRGIIESGLDFDNPQYADECKKELLQILDKVKD